jgi:hypothetical protein
MLLAGLLVMESEWKLDLAVMVRQNDHFVAAERRDKVVVPAHARTHSIC